MTQFHVGTSECQVPNFFITSITLQGNIYIFGMYNCDDLSPLKANVESDLSPLATKSTTECQVFIMYGDYKMSGSSSENNLMSIVTCLESLNKIYNFNIWYYD